MSSDLYCYGHDWTPFITGSPKPLPPRNTFTLHLINSASVIAMVVTGEDAINAIKVAWANMLIMIYLFPVQKVKFECGVYMVL